MTIAELVAAWRDATRNLQDARAKEYPVGKQVYINSGRYVGFGQVVKDYACPISQVAVKISNGNVWYYPIEDCREWKAADL